MYLALDAFWDDNVTIISEFDLVDAERLVKQFVELHKSGVHNTVRNTFRVNYCYVSCQNKQNKNVPSDRLLSTFKECRRLYCIAVLCCICCIYSNK